MLFSNDSQRGGGQNKQGRGNGKERKDEADKLAEALKGQRAEMVETMLEDENLPEMAEDELGPFFGKEMALTFLKERDVTSLMNAYDDTVTSILMNKFPHQHSGADETNFTQLRARLRAKLLRSRGKGRHNERKMWETSINEALYEEPNQSSGGIISSAKSSLSKAFGGGR